MRLRLHEERISNKKIAPAKIDIVAETVAREVADMKLAKAREPLSVRKGGCALIHRTGKNGEEGLRKTKEQPLSPWSQNS